MEFKKYSCHACKEQFVVACLSELQAKLKKHKCPTRTKNDSKKRERSKQLEQNRIALYVHDAVVNHIEKHNFDNLVKRGMIVGV